MLRSMTGFGAASSDASEATVVGVEVRSVNHRHLTVKVRLPETLGALEGEVEGRVRAACERGSVSVNVQVAPAAGANGATLDRALARRYARELASLADELGLAPTLSLDTLATLPGVLSGAPTPADGRDLQAVILKRVEEALQAMLTMRAAEGRALAVDLRKNSKALLLLCARIEKRMPRVVRAQRAALEKRLTELLGPNSPVARQDLAREVALLADKLDVSEELSRLASHLAQFEAAVARGGRIGRQLDFLVQEVFREVNTIGSKCSDATVAHWVVEAKTYVERLREQVQNVE